MRQGGGQLLDLALLAKCQSGNIYDREQKHGGVEYGPPPFQFARHSHKSPGAAQEEESGRGLRVTSFVAASMMV